MKNITFGAELELADIDTSIELPEGATYCFKDGSICNSSGVSNDPLKQFNKFGSEIQTKPCNSSEELLEEIFKIYSVFDGKYSFNYTTNLHIHIRIPEILNNLPILKNILSYNNKFQKELFSLIDPIPVPNKNDYSEEDYKSAIWRYNRRKRSHQYCLPEAYFNVAMKAETVKDFFEGFAPKDKNGKVCWGASTRCGINLLQMYRETETIEFRCFNMSDDPVKLRSAIKIVELYMEQAIKNSDVSPSDILKKENWMDFQHFRQFDPKLDKIFKKTSVLYNKRKDVLKNISELLETNVINKEQIK